jgi:FtsH-binding integral membrane protein
MTKLIFGIISCLFGLMIYYLLPKGMINQNVGLLLFVFFTILMGLLLGLILLAYSVQYLIERVIAYLTLFWVNRTDFILTLKNMSAHRFKNRRSALLYSLSVAFVIFVSVGISIQIQTIS